MSLGKSFNGYTFINNIFSSYLPLFDRRKFDFDYLYRPQFYGVDKHPTSVGTNIISYCFYVFDQYSCVGTLQITARNLPLGVRGM